MSVRLREAWLVVFARPPGQPTSPSANVVCFKKFSFDFSIYGVFLLQHKIQIQKAIQNLNKAIKSLSINMPIDIVAIGLKDVLSDLGEITGEITNEDQLDFIFSKFCIGK